MKKFKTKFGSNFSTFKSNINKIRGKLWVELRKVLRKNCGNISKTYSDFENKIGNIEQTLKKLLDNFK